MNLIYIFLATVYASINLVQNGGFEIAAQVYCKASRCILNDINAIAPWKLTAGSQFALEKSSSVSQSGDYFLDLNAGSPYSITQDIPTVSGQRYVLTFYVNKKTWDGCGDKDRYGMFQVSGQAKIVIAHAEGFREWFKVRNYFTALSSSTSLTIGSTTVGDCGPVIDNVRMEII
jgi:hypothetical protein